MDMATIGILSCCQVALSVQSTRKQFRLSAFWIRTSMQSTFVIIFVTRLSVKVKLYWKTALQQEFIRPRGGMVGTKHPFSQKYNNPCDDSQIVKIVIEALKHRVHKGFHNRT